MMKMKENQLAVQSLNSVLPAIKQLFLDCSYNEIKEAVIWYAANRNRYNKDAASANLAEELNYIDIKDTFYKENGLKPNAKCRDVLEVMCRLADMPNPEIYYGIDHGASIFSKIRSGRIKPTRKLLTAFSVNMGLDECYARMLFEANGMKMSETDRKSYREGIKDSRDLGYLMVYDKKENTKASAR